MYQTVIVVKGGIVQNIISDCPDMEFKVMDFDQFGVETEWSVADELEKKIDDVVLQGIRDENS